MKIINLALSLLTLGFVVSCSSNRQEFYTVPSSVLTSINIVDRNGLTETINNPERLCQYAEINFLTPQPFQKVLRIYSRDFKGNIPAIITSYHPNGYPCKYLEVLNSRAFGQYKEWYPNSVQKISANIIEGNSDIVDGSEKTWVFDGICEAWNECGELEASIPYVKGVLDGVSTYYHANGNVWKTIPYKQNMINGTATIFRSDGKVLQTTNYCNNLKEGESFRYWEDGKLAAEEYYSEGLLTSGTYFDLCLQCIAKIENGTGKRPIFGKDSILEIGEYKAGVLDGEVTLLDKQGRITSLYHARNGNKHGEEIIYYELSRFQQTQTPKLSINWFEGKIQGVVKTWYNNGVQESKKEMTNNKKNGHTTAWYRDGSLMMIEEYEQDRLMKGEYYNKGEKYPLSIVDEGKGTVSILDPEGNFVRKIEYMNGKPILDD